MNCELIVCYLKAKMLPNVYPSVSLLVMDWAGRRVLLMVSGTVMAVCMAGLATYLTLGEAVPGEDFISHVNYYCILYFV